MSDRRPADDGDAPGDGAKTNADAPGDDVVPTGDEASSDDRGPNDGTSADAAPDDGTTTRRWPLNGVMLAVLWLFVRGVDLTPVRIAEEFLIGLLVGMPVAFAVRRFYAPQTPLSRSARVAPYAVLYLFVFLREVITANFDVAWRVVSPSMPIDPAVVEVPLRVRGDVAITTIANSISLTPGTITMDYDSETNTLYVHSIDGSDPEAVLEPIRTWEEYALVIFDEELKPGDPVPEPTPEEVSDGE